MSSVLIESTSAKLPQGYQAKLRWEKHCGFVATLNRTADDGLSYMVESNTYGNIERKVAKRRFRSQAKRWEESYAD